MWFGTLHSLDPKQVVTSACLSLASLLSLGLEKLSAHLDGGQGLCGAANRQ
jgi:hypothetical protein